MINTSPILTSNSQCSGDRTSCSDIAHTTLVVSSVSTSHSQCVGVGGSGPLICHNLREVMATVITDHITSSVQVTVVAGPPVEVQVRVNTGGSALTAESRLN